MLMVGGMGGLCNWINQRVCSVWVICKAMACTLARGVHAHNGGDNKVRGL